jgi:hypothetical protein
MASPASPPRLKDPGPIRERNANLAIMNTLKVGAARHDVEYIPASALLRMTFRAEYDFDPSISLDDQTIFKQKTQQAMSWWDNSGFFLRTDHPEALNKTIRLGFRLVESPADFHKAFDVGPAPPPGEKTPRANVGFFDVNVSIVDTITTLAHELGHVLGNPDEYREREALKSLCSFLWHDDRFNDDSAALMCHGNEFRARYFSHFLFFVNKHFEDLGIEYRIASSPPVPFFDPPDVPAAAFVQENLTRRLDYGSVVAGSFPVWGGASKKPGPTGM